VTLRADTTMPRFGGVLFYTSSCPEILPLAAPFFLGGGLVAPAGKVKGVFYEFMSFRSAACCW